MNLFTALKSIQNKNNMILYNHFKTGHLKSFAHGTEENTFLKNIIKLLSSLLLFFTWMPLIKVKLHSSEPIYRPLICLVSPLSSPLCRLE